jgi:hypothetical protein
LPAPSALSTFTSGSNPSLQASSTSDVTVVDRQNAQRLSILGFPFSPSLGLIPTPKAWSEVSPGETASPGSYGGDQENDIGADITIDVLEEEPPAAGEGWRSMAAILSLVGGSEGERLARRTTFGTVSSTLHVLFLRY